MVLKVKVKMKQTLLTICIILFSLPSWGDNVSINKKSDALNNILETLKKVKNNNQNKIKTPSTIYHLREKLKTCWQIVVNPEIQESPLIVDILIEVDKKGFVDKAEWINKGNNGNNSNYIVLANSAFEAINNCQPLPLPLLKSTQDKIKIVLRFDPTLMFR